MSDEEWTDEDDRYVSSTEAQIDGIRYAWRRTRRAFMTGFNKGRKKNDANRDDQG